MMDWTWREWLRLAGCLAIAFFATKTFRTMAASTLVSLWCCLVWTLFTDLVWPKAGEWGSYLYRQELAVQDFPGFLGGFLWGDRRSLPIPRLA